MSHRGDRGRGGRGTPERGGRGQSPAGDRGGGRGMGGPGFRGGPPHGGFGGGPPRGGGGPPRGGRGGFGGSREVGGVFAADKPAVIDARLTDKSQEKLVESFRTLTVRDNDLPLRPDFGKVGVAIKLRANFFPFKDFPKGPLYEYDVAISPAAGTAPRRVKRRIFKLAEQTPDWANRGLRGVVAHDHASKVISAKKLTMPITITVPFYDEDQSGPTADSKEYTLTFQFVQELNTQRLMGYLAGRPDCRDYDTAPVIAALNVILAAFPSRAGAGGGVMVGRNRFFFPSPDAAPVSLGGGLEAWRGFYSSVRPTYNQLMVNVNACTTAFYTPGNLADAMTTFQRSSFGARPAAFVKGVRIKTTHLGYTKTVKGLARETARQYRFDAGELGNVTVEQYFAKKYKKRLQYPDLPLVDVGGQRSNYLPPEVCEILPGQPFRGKLTDDHTAAMITVACKPPNVNAASIVGPGLRELGYPQRAPPLSAFGISIGTEMAVVPGRILPAPSIKYKSGTPQVDERASWNLRGVKFGVGAKLEKWAVLLIQDGNPGEFRDPNDPELRTIVSGFASMCRTSGMTVDAANPLIAQARLPPKDNGDPTRGEAIKAINEALTKQLKSKPNLVLVILSNGDKHVYSGLKHLCDCRLGVATVCVHANKIRKEKGQPQYFANVALKVNMKMGGVNHFLDPKNMSWLQQMPTMLVGMDVTHPGPGSVKGTPSIAAVVGSIDNQFAQYPASMEIQESKKEMITNLTNMMVERLTAFKTRNVGKLPERILVYRDGVSEGQFNIVVAEELPAIKASFRKFHTAQRQYNPKLTIVICGKRHHTRFYPTEAAHADRDGNPRPGTVVDRGVTAVYDFDFFLQAHGGLQGTTRPTHYYVVYDEIKFKSDELQGLTNSVSYMFARATKAVSLVSPAYYADLACERGRCYLHKLLQGLGSSGVTSTTNDEQVKQEATRMWQAGVHASLKNTMFYL